MPITNGIYYENQQGGACRLHALNAFFGKQLITGSEFAGYMRQFDSHMKEKYKQDISCKDFDIVNSDQNNIVSYILKKKGYYLRYIHINGLYGKPMPLDDIDEDFIFVYNKSHIWGLRKHQELWWRVDSLKGVRRTNIYKIPKNKNIGVMIPVDMKKELFKHANDVKDILKKEHIVDKVGIVNYLKKLNERKEIMGDLEIHMGIIMDIIEARCNKIGNSKKYDDIYDLLKMYNSFLTDFVEKKYSLNVLIEHIPNIISLLMMSTFKIGIY